MKKFKCLLNRVILSILFVCLGISSIAQLAGSVDTTFNPNYDGIPFSTTGYFGARGVEIVGNSVYYGFSGEPGLPKIRKYDFNGNEDENWYSNQMSTWGTQFATLCMEPERDNSGNYTGEFFICGRNSYNSMVNQGVRFLNKINADGTRDLNFICPYTSWISMCSTVYHDWENNKLYYCYQSGYSSVNYYQTIVCCDPNTGQVLQTIEIPGNNGLVRKIVKLPNSNDLIFGGDLNFTYNGNQYVGLFKLTEQFTIEPINGVTNLPGNFVVSDILFVDDTDCGGNSIGNTKIYIAGGGNSISGINGLRSIARYTLNGNDWNIDSNYNAGCSGSIGDIAYYNCHLIATGNFASSMPTGPYAPVWTPKITSFTSDGLISDEFKLTNTGSGLGGIYVSGFENSYGQGSGSCLVVNSSNDGSNNWEIFVGGSFVSLIQGPSQPRNILKPLNFMAKLNGFGNSINSKFDYCLTEINSNQFEISTFEISNTSGCEKWELFGSSNIPFSWSLIRTETSHDFMDTTLLVSKWYKLVRTITECGNSCSSSYIIYKEPGDCQFQGNAGDLRQLIIRDEVSSKIDDVIDVGSISVFPNPTNGIVTLTDNFKDQFRVVSIYNSIGAKVYSKTYNSNNYKLDITDLPGGVYMIVINTDTGVEKQQIIKE